MTNAQRKHVLLPAQIAAFLEDYQARHHLGSFSASVEAAARALRQQELEHSYREYAQECTQDAQAQQEAERWLGFWVAASPPRSWANWTAA